jgi:hypothetical protein
MAWKESQDERLLAMSARQRPEAEKDYTPGHGRSWNAQKKEKTKILHLSPFLPPD